MQFAIRHFMPGRVRLAIPALCYDRGLAEEMLAWLRAQSAVRAARTPAVDVSTDMLAMPMFSRRAATAGSAGR